MPSIALSTLYLPGVVVYQTQAAAIASGEKVIWNPSQQPQYWRAVVGAIPGPVPAALPVGYDPDGAFPIHNLHDANGSAVYGLSFIPNSQAVTLNIPPDQSGSNPVVYPASIPIPMVYPLPAGDSDIDTPFGIILSYMAPTPVPTPPPNTTDPVLAEILANTRTLVGLAGKVPA